MFLVDVTLSELAMDAVGVFFLNLNLYVGIWDILALFRNGWRIHEIYSAHMIFCSVCHLILIFSERMIPMPGRKIDAQNIVCLCVKWTQRLFKWHVDDGILYNEWPWIRRWRRFISFEEWRKRSDEDKGESVQKRIVKGYSHQKASPYSHSKPKKKSKPYTPKIC